MTKKNKKIVTLSMGATAIAGTALSVVLPLEFSKRNQRVNYLKWGSKEYNAIKNGGYFEKALKASEEIFKAKKGTSAFFALVKDGKNNKVAYKKDGTVTVFCHDSVPGAISSQATTGSITLNQQPVTSIIEFKTKEVNSNKEVYVSSAYMDFGGDMGIVDIQAVNINTLNNITYNDKAGIAIVGNLQKVMKTISEDNQKNKIFEVNDVIKNQKIVDGITADNIIDAIMAKPTYNFKNRKDLPLDTFKQFTQPTDLIIDNITFSITVSKIVPDYEKGNITFDYKINFKDKKATTAQVGRFEIKGLQAKQTNKQIADGIANQFKKLSITSYKKLLGVGTPADLTEQILKSIGTLKGLYPTSINKNATIKYSTPGGQLPLDDRIENADLKIEISVKDKDALHPETSPKVEAHIPVKIMNKDAQAVSTIQKVIKAYVPKNDIKTEIQSVQAGTTFDQTEINKFFKDAKLPLIPNQATVTYSVPNIKIGKKGIMRIIISSGSYNQTVEHTFSVTSKSITEKVSDATAFLNAINKSSLSSLGDGNTEVANVHLINLKSQLDQIFTPQDGVNAVYKVNKSLNDSAKGIFGLTVKYKFSNSKIVAKDFLVGGYKNVVPTNPIQAILNGLTVAEINKALGTASGDAIGYNLPKTTHVAKTGAEGDIVVTLTKGKVDNFEGTIAYTYSANIPSSSPALKSVSGSGILSGFNKHKTDVQKKSEAMDFLNNASLPGIKDHADKWKASTELVTSIDFTDHMNNTFTLLNKERPSYEFDSTDDDTGTINVKVSYTYGSEIASKVFALTGYETNDYADVYAIKDPKITELLKNAKSYTNAMEAKDYGDFPAIGPFNGVTFTVTKGKVDNYAGVINYTYTAKKGKAVKNNHGWLKKFKTNLTEIQKYNLDQDYLNSISGEKLNLEDEEIKEINPATITNTSIPWPITKLFDLLKGTNVLTIIQSGDGTLTIKAEDTVGTQNSIIKQYTFSGFKTNDEILENAKKEASKIISSIIAPIVDPNKHSNKAHLNIAFVKNNALEQIAKAPSVQAVNILVSSSTTGTSINSVKDAITAYNNSTGMDQDKVEYAKTQLYIKDAILHNKDGLQAVSVGTEFTDKIANAIGFTYRPHGVKTTFSHSSLSADGSFTISFVLTKGSATATKDVTFNVTGINAAKEKYAIDQIQQKINDVKKFLNGKTGNLSTNNKSGINAIAEGTAYNSNVATGYGWTLPTQSDVSITYAHGEIKKDGNLIIKFKINAIKGREETATATIAVTGIDQAILNSLTKAEVKNAIGALRGNANDFTWNNHVNITKQGQKIEVNLVKKHVNNFAGTIDYSYTANISSSSTALTPKTGSDTLKGFNRNKTDAEKKVAAQAYLDTIATTLPAIENQDTRKASDIKESDRELHAHLAQLFKSQEGVQASVAIKSNNDVAGTISIRISYGYGADNIPELAFKDFNFSGYETQVQRDHKDTYDIHSNDIVDAIKAKTPYSNTDEATTYVIPTLGPINGATITVTVTPTDRDAYKGKIHFAYTVTKGNAHKESTGTLSGFKTNLTDAEKVAKDQIALDSITGNKLALTGKSVSDIDPSKLSASKTPLKNKIALPNKLTKLFKDLYGTTTFNLLNIGDGSREIKVTSKVGQEASINKTYIFTGFKTDAIILTEVKNKAIDDIDHVLRIIKPKLDPKKHSQALFDDLNNKIKQAKTDINNALTTTDVYKLSTAVGFDINIPSLKGTAGEPIMDAFDMYIKSTGTDKSDVDSALALFTAHSVTINSIHGLDAVAANTGLTGAAARKLGFTLPTNVDSIEYEHLVITTNGVLKVKITIEKGSEKASKEINITITGIDETKLSIAQTTAENSIKTINIPTLDAVNHSEAKYNLMISTKADILKEIKDSNSPSDISLIASSASAGTGISQIKNALAAYNSSTGTAKILEDAKTKAKQFISEQFAKAQKDDALHDAKIYIELERAKKTAIKNIEAVNQPEDATAFATSLTTGTEIVKIKKLVEDYNKSTGTDEELKNTKAYFMNMIVNFSLPPQNDALHDAALYNDITNAIQTSKDNLAAVKTTNELNELFSKPNIIQNALDAYNNSKGTDWENVKRALDTFIDENVAINDKNGLPVVAIGTTLDQATATKIGLGSLPTGVQSIKYEHAAIRSDGKLKVLITISQGSVTEGKAIHVTINGINQAKVVDAQNRAKDFVNRKFNSIQKDDAAHSASVFANKVVAAKNKALSDINAATTIAAATAIASSTTSGTGITEIQTAITAYNGSTGITKILNDAKKTAIDIITNISVPTVNSAEHDQTAFNKIAAAKTAAKTAVNNTATPNAILLLVKSSTVGSEVSKINDVINKYKASTGTDRADVDTALKRLYSKNVTVDDKNGLPNKPNPILLNSSLASELGFGTLVSGVIINYTHSAISADGDMILHLIASKGSAQNITKDITLAITGIDAAKEKSLVAQANQNITSARQEINGKTGSIVKSDKSGISALSSPAPYTASIASSFGLIFPTAAGITITYTHPAIAVDGNLRLTFKINLPKGTEQTATATVAVTGISQAILNTITNADIETAIGTLSGDANDYAWVNHVNITKASLGRVKVILTKGPVNNYTGKIDYTYSANIANSSTLTAKTGSGTLTGFNLNKTDAEKKAATQKILDAVTLPAITGKNAIKASTITATNVSFLNHVKKSFSTQLGIEPTFATTTASDITGTVNVTVAYTYGTEVATKDFALTGYQTQDQADDIDVHAIHSDNIVDAIKAKTPYSNSDEATTYVIPTLDPINGATITVTVAPTDRDTYKGKIHFAYTVTKGNAHKESTGTLSGFKTNLTDAEKVAKDQIVLDSITGDKLNLAKNNSTIELIDPATITTVAKLPNKLTKLFKALIGTKVFSAITPGDGFVTVTISDRVGNETPISKTYTFTGFKTNATLLKEAKDLAIQSINLISIPNVEPALHDQVKFDNIAVVKQAAINTINAATSVATATSLASHVTATLGPVTTSGTEVDKVNAAINEYKASTGTDVTDVANALATFNNSTATINNIHGLPVVASGSILSQSAATTLGLGTLPTNVDSIKYEHAIVSANGTVAITITVNKGSKTDSKSINVAVSGIDEAILIKAKKTATDLVKGIIIPVKDFAAHGQTEFTAITTAKNAALNAIKTTTSPSAVSAIASSATTGSGITSIKAAITAYRSSTGTTKILNDAKNAAKGFVNGIVNLVSRDDALHDKACYFELTDFQKSAINKIDAAGTKADVDALASSATQGTEITKLIKSVDVYNKSTGTTKISNDAKAKAKGIVDSIIVPTQNDALHDSSLFGAIATAKSAAKTAIDNATGPTGVTALVSSITGGSETHNIIAAINVYKNSTGTDVTDVATALNTFTDQTITISDAQGLPVVTSGSILSQSAATTLGLGTLPTNVDSIEYEHAKLSADGRINVRITVTKGSVTNNKNIHITVSGITRAILSAIRKVSKSFVNGITIPTQDDAAHNASLFGAIATAKAAALASIDAASTAAEVKTISYSPTSGGGIAAIRTAIRNYNNSTGTAKILADAKTTAEAFVNGITIPTQDDAAHDASLFGAIATAKTAALANITASITPAAATAIASSSTSGTGVDTIKAAITAYTTSTGTAKILADAKTTAEAFINGITIPTQDDAAHNASLFGAIATAKAAALANITASITPAVATAIASSATSGTGIASINSAITAYTTSTGTAKILADAKTTAEAFVNGITIPTQDDAAHDASLFGAIATAKAAALASIDAAATSDVVIAIASQNLTGTGIASINSAITAYTTSTGTAKILADAKTTAEAFVNGITIPTQDDAAHDASLFGAIATAKAAALASITASITPAAATAIASSSTSGTGITSINSAITAYTASTGTTAALALAKANAQTEIDNAVAAKAIPTGISATQLSANAADYTVPASSGTITYSITSVIPKVNNLTDVTITITVSSSVVGTTPGSYSVDVAVTTPTVVAPVTPPAAPVTPPTAATETTSPTAATGTTSPTGTTASTGVPAAPAGALNGTSRTDDATAIYK